MPLPADRLLDELPPEAGIYALLLSCRRRAVIRIGKLGELRLRPGLYVYLGSACGPGGLRARIGHHLRIAGRPHWHVDYLRPWTEVQAAWCRTGREESEHDWALCIRRLPGALVPLPGFGSSDCRCESHLFFFRTRFRPPALRLSRAVLYSTRTGRFRS
ncbi:MAG: GIY-YIG nuclease family protein [Bryobacterales bacterium]|nr:GIY-YIG nuclease family protein [Bryobacterales bacterium]